jgi:acetylornithine deacetylase/succinyl-diaminopimelate desuccinylase
MEIEKLFAWIDERELAKIVQDMIRIPSHSETPGQEREVSGFVEEMLGGWGYDVALQEVQDGRSNVIATAKGEKGGRSLLLNGHLDTVPPGQRMMDPYGSVIKDGRLYGRGSSDMKGAIGAMLYTLYLLKRCEIHLRLSKKVSVKG